MGAQYCLSLKGVLMRVLAMHCTGPCGVQPGSRSHCVKLGAIEYGAPALPDPETSLSAEVIAVLCGLVSKYMCPHIDASKCQLWVGEMRTVFVWAELITDELVAEEVADVETVTGWIQAVLDDPQHVPDAFTRAMTAIHNTEALDRLVAACIEARRTPVYRLHRLSEGVSA